jgi:hypothetical protein
VKALVQLLKEFPEPSHCHRIQIQSFQVTPFDALHDLFIPVDRMATSLPIFPRAEA